MNNSRELILFRKQEENHLNDLLDEMSGLLLEQEEGRLCADAKAARSRYCAVIQGLAELAESHGFSGNLWHCYLTYLLVYHENAYSRACEMRGATEGGINGLAHHDFEIFMQLFACDFSSLEEELGISCYGAIAAYESAGNERKIFNRRIRDRICDLAVRLAAAADAVAFQHEMETFYREFGVGKFGLHKDSASYTLRQAAYRLHRLPILPMSIWTIWWDMRSKRKS
jgi:hypothetical protein